MTEVNRRITLGARPVGFPRISDFQLVYCSLPSPEAGEVLLRTLYFSLDPSTRERMNASDACAMALGEVIPGAAVAVVMRSLDAGLRPGDVVEGMLGWQEFATAPASDLRRIHRDAASMSSASVSSASVSSALGVLGAPGLTAFLGLLDVCDPQPGETVVVSGAAGAVGMLAGQIARIRGCRAVGLASSAEGTAWLLGELAFDAALDDQGAQELDRALDEACPAGVDVYLDNAGGTASDAVLGRINSRSRIAVCGQMSQLNLEVPEMGPRFLGRLIAQQATIRGFLLAGFTPRFGEARRQLAAWLAEGQLKVFEEVAQGIESAPQAFIGMLNGRSQGQQLVQLFDV